MRIDASAYPNIRRRFGVDIAPTLLLFESGENIGRAPVSDFLAAEATDEHLVISADRLKVWIDKAIMAAAASSRNEDGLFGRCLLRNDMLSYSHAFRPNIGSTLTLFGVCRNQTCVDEAHAQRWGGHFSPVGRASTSPVGARPSIAALGNMPSQRVVKVDDVVCDGSVASEREAVRRAREAFATSRPLVMRGCAAGMPAMHWWHNDSMLRGRGASADHVFAPLLGDRAPDAVGMLTPGDAWAADLRWQSVVSDELASFTTTPHAWVSRGGKDAAMHFDTVNNYHVVLGDDKRFDVISPADLPKMYIDFPRQSGPDPVVRCPDKSVFGCDDFGCYGYVPFQPSRVNLDEYPRVREATVHTTTLARGDILALPSFWLHRIRHFPIDGGRGGAHDAGRNIALAFIQPHPSPSERPFAEDIAQWWTGLQKQEGQAVAAGASQGVRDKAEL